MADKKDNMLIILTTGAEDRGNRATLAFATGVSSLVSGVKTTIFLTMGGTFWSRRRAADRVHVDGFDALRDYIKDFLEMGGNLMVCSPCNEFYCSIAADEGLIDGAEVCGLAHVVDLSLSASTVTL